MLHSVHIFSPKWEKKQDDTSFFMTIHFGYPQTHSLWISIPVDKKMRTLPPFFAKEKSYAPFFHMEG